MSRPMRRPYYHIDCKALGLRIHARRQSINMSQQELANRIGCSPTHISRVEAGRMPSLTLLYAICRELNISMDEMLGINPHMDYHVYKVTQIMNRVSETERELIVHLVTTLENFFHQLHKNALYNRFSDKKQYSYPSLDAALGKTQWLVAEDPKGAQDNAKGPNDSKENTKGPNDSKENTKGPNDSKENP